MPMGRMRNILSPSVIRIHEPYNGRSVLSMILKRSYILLSDGHLYSIKSVGSHIPIKCYYQKMEVRGNAWVAGSLCRWKLWPGMV